MPMPYERFGRFGENVVACWLRARGNTLLPVRDIQMGHVWKGPRMTGPEGIERVATDWLVTTPTGQVVYSEVKRKHAFSWHRNTREWVTGIDQHYLDHYVRTRQTSNIDMWLLFVHLNGEPTDADLKQGCPNCCPTGIFGAEIRTLANEVHHTHGNWGKGGMVYWTAPPLKLLATLNELQPSIDAAQHQDEAL